MPEAVLTAPWTDDTGHTYQAGESVDLSDEEYAAMRADGKVQSVEKQEAPSHFGDVTARPAASNDEAVPVAEREEPPEPVKTPQQASKKK